MRRSAELRSLLLGGSEVSFFLDGEGNEAQPGWAYRLFDRGPVGRVPRDRRARCRTRADLLADPLSRRLAFEERPLLGGGEAEVPADLLLLALGERDRAFLGGAHQAPQGVRPPVLAEVAPLRGLHAALGLLGLDLGALALAVGRFALPLSASDLLLLVLSHQACPTS